MPKFIMTTSLSLALLLLLGMATPGMAQTCRSESEIPSNTPSSDFTDNGDGTVTHQSTGLMWMKCPLGQSSTDCSSGSANTYTWGEALQVADTISFTGYSDWRLPNKNELFSIVERRCYDPAINIAVFPGTASWYFWSSSPNAYASNNAWDVDFRYGYANGVNRLNGGLQVRLVRSGQ